MSDGTVFRTAHAIDFETGAKPSRFAHFWQGAESIAPATPNRTLTSKVVRDY